MVQANNPTRREKSPASRAKSSGCRVQVLERSGKELDGPSRYLGASGQELGGPGAQLRMPRKKLGRPSKEFGVSGSGALRAGGWAGLRFAGHRRGTLVRRNSVMKKPAQYGTAAPLSNDCVDRRHLRREFHCVGRRPMCQQRSGFQLSPAPDPATAAFLLPLHPQFHLCNSYTHKSVG